MRKLDRSLAKEPTCLSEYQHGTQKWDDVAAPHKTEIRTSLESMQGRRCAYCEGSVDVLGQHIDHFRCRHRFPKRTFDWQNLYWSCDKQDSCGRYKDNSAEAYAPDSIIDPCADDPDKFFRFRSDGTIQIRAGLSAADQRRASETIRVFNLDPAYGRLRQMRQRALEAYCARQPNILDALLDFDPDLRADFIAAELSCTAADPFASVIRHFFEQVA